MAAPYYEIIDEEQIITRVKEIEEAGNRALDLDRLLTLGQVYKDYGMTPIYLLDDDNERFKIAIKETQDRSKLH